MPQKQAVVTPGLRSSGAARVTAGASASWAAEDMAVLSETSGSAACIPFDGDGPLPQGRARA